MESHDARRRRVTVDNESWSGLPSDILINLALKHVTSAAAYATLRSVCRHWRLSIPAAVPLPHRLPPQLPFLLLLDKQPSNPVRPILSLATRRTCALRHLADTVLSACVGSCHGWLFLLDRDYNLALRNPFTGDTFRLPSLNDILAFRPAVPYRTILEDDPFRHHHVVRRAILSSDPSADRSFSAVLFLSEVKSRCFAWRSGDQLWTACEHPEFIPKEIMFFKDRLCLALAYNRSCAIFDFAAATGGEGFFRMAPGLPDSGSPFLVESAGSVRLVTVKIVGRREAMVRVYRLDFSRLPDVTALEEYDLGGRIFFLAHSNSMSVASTDFPGFKGDSIFFTKITWNAIFGSYIRILWEVRIKIGVSHLHDMGQKPAGFRMCMWPKPLWVPPNLHEKLV